MNPSTERKLWMYEKMIEIREYEETMARVYMEGKLPPHIQKGLAFDIGSGPVPGEMHLAAGQEPWRWACAPTCMTTTPWSARTARTTSPSPRACRSTP